MQEKTLHPGLFFLGRRSPGFSHISIRSSPKSPGSAVLLPGKIVTTDPCVFTVCQTLSVISNLVFMKIEKEGTSSLG